MIVIQHQSNRVAVNVYGEFTLADFKEFEDMVNYKVKFEGVVDLLFDLREMADFTLDVAWEDIIASLWSQKASGWPGVLGCPKCSSVPTCAYLTKRRMQRHGLIRRRRWREFFDLGVLRAAC